MPLNKLVRMCAAVAAALSLSASAGIAAESAWRGKVTAFAAEHFKNPAWGFSHSKRDYALARSLAASDHVALDDDVLFAAAYLHDMDAFPPWDAENGEHGDVSATKIDLVLANSDFPKAKLGALRAAIRTHMFNRDPIGPEARYLHDADTLDWLGAIGIVRIFGLVDPKGGKPTGPDAVKNIEVNLAAARSRLLSASAKAMAASRIGEERVFLDALRRETGNLSTL